MLVPRISSFYGIVITMYHDEHGLPHFHARYAEHDASIGIETLEIFAGYLPPRARRMVETWAQPHRRELRANWERAREGGQLRAIDPLPRILTVKPLVHPVQVKPLGGHRLWLRFEDGAEGEVDLADHSWDGVFAPLRDPGYFAQVRLDPEIRTIAWPNVADIAPETLHAWVTGAALPD